MPVYTFTGAFETVLNGLSNGGNAHLRRHDVDGQPVDTEQPDGSTVVAQAGDEITTDEIYPNAWMVNTATGQPDEPSQDAPQIAADKPAEPDSSPSSEPAPVAAGDIL